LSRHPGPYLISHRQRIPWVLLCLLDAEADSTINRINLEYYCFYLLADREKLRGVLEAFGPGHFSHVHKPFDTGLKFHKGTVISKAYNLAPHTYSLRIALDHGLPWIRYELLVPERDSFLFAVKLQYFYLD